MARNIVSYDDIVPPHAGPSNFQSCGQDDAPNSLPKRQKYAHSPTASTPVRPTRKPRDWEGRRAGKQPRYDLAESSFAPSVGAGTSFTATSFTASLASTSMPSVDLSQEDIWDDSALVDAWDAAQEEYRIMNGPEKDWKRDPVHKSPLWYQEVGVNDEVGSSALNRSSTTTAHVQEASADPDADEVSAVLSHEPPTAETPAVEPPSIEWPLENGSAPLVSRDEAFQNALNAMYWSGYWTAAYHYQNQNQQHEAAEEDLEEADGEETMDGDGFMAAQR